MLTFNVILDVFGFRLLKNLKSLFSVFPLIFIPLFFSCCLILNYRNDFRFSLFLNIYIYTYTYVYICIHIYKYTHTYIFNGYCKDYWASLVAQ